jgi:DNA-binding NtrC family response regulator
MDRQAMQERFGIIGTSAGMRQALDRVRLVAGTDITVLIQGESGVGKELFAQALHEMSRRRHKQMLVMNCGAMPEGLIESELFGNEKGAYTGAVERRQGYFEEADGSSIFLDEIGEMPLKAQVRLLRVLETGEFSRVGSSTLLRSDVRVIAATNKDLGKEVEAGRFREDLYYRLSTVLLHVPPLRDRREDILPIFDHFQHRFTQKYNSSAPRMDSSARDLLIRYRWPGNIRELRNVAEQTVVLLRGNDISEEDIRPYLRGVTAGGTGVGLVSIGSGSGSNDESAIARERELIYRILVELRVEVREMKEQIAQLVAASRNTGSTETKVVSDPSRLLAMRDQSQNHDDFIEEAPYEFASPSDSDEARNSELGPLISLDGDLPTLEYAERTLILTALKRFEGNRRQTAESLGISERTLYRKLKDIEATEKATA